MSEGAKKAEKLTRIYLKMKAKKAEIVKEFKAQEAALDEQMDKVKNALLTYCKDNGVESVKTNSGTFYRTVKTRYWSGDWEAMHKFIMENNMPDFLEKRLNQTNVKQFLEENPDTAIDGLNVDSEYIINVRKPK